jgi:hypothetical protein
VRLGQPPAVFFQGVDISNDFGILTRWNLGVDLFVARGIAAIRIASSSVIFARVSFTVSVSENAEK